MILVGVLMLMDAFFLGYACRARMMLWIWIVMSIGCIICRWVIILVSLFLWWLTSNYRAVTWCPEISKCTTAFLAFIWQSNAFAQTDLLSWNWKKWISEVLSFTGLWQWSRVASINLVLWFYSHLFVSFSLSYFSCLHPTHYSPIPHPHPDLPVPSDFDSHWDYSSLNFGYYFPYSSHYHYQYHFYYLNLYSYHFIFGQYHLIVYLFLLFPTFGTAFVVLKL